MATPVEISFVKTRDQGCPDGRIEGLGGLFRDRPWYMSERNLIAEVEKPDATRTWDFHVRAGTDMLPLVVSIHDGRKYLATPGENGDSARLLALPQVSPAFAARCR